MYRSLAGLCCRALRLDLLLLAAHQLSALATVSHMCEEQDVMEVHPAIGSLTRLSARAAEELGPFLGRSKAAYAFSPLAGAGKGGREHVYAILHAAHAAAAAAPVSPACLKPRPPR